MLYFKGFSPDLYVQYNFKNILMHKSKVDTGVSLVYKNFSRFAFYAISFFISVSITLTSESHDSCKNASAN